MQRTFFAWQGVKAKRGNIHSVGNKQKSYILRFKYDFCEKTTKVALRNGSNIDWGNILFVYPKDVKGNGLD